MDYKVLINRKIIDILIGDVNVYNEYKLPYLSGPDYWLAVFEEK